jgi:twitching motility protein PilJ
MRSSLATLRAALYGLGLLAAASVFADDGACRAQADSRALSAALIGTLSGDAQSFDRTQASMAAVNRDVRLGSDTTADDAAFRRFLAGMSARANVLQQQREIVQQVHERLGAISRASSDLLDASETLSSLMLQANASPAHVAAVMQLDMLSVRLGRSADNFIGWDGIRPEAVFLLGKDLRTFDVLLSGLADGNAELRLRAQHDPAIVKQLAKVRGVLAGMRANAQYFIDHLKELVAAREAQAALQQDADQLGHTLAISCAGSDAGVAGPLLLPSQAASAPQKGR